MKFRLMQACGQLLAIGCVLAACNGLNQPSSEMSNADKAAARASVDIARDCNKPWFDTVSASDHTTVIKGMTPIEREVCATQPHMGSDPASR